MTEGNKNLPPVVTSPSKTSRPATPTAACPVHLHAKIRKPTVDTITNGKSGNVPRRSPGTRPHARSTSRNNANADARRRRLLGLRALRQRRTDHGRRRPKCGSSSTRPRTAGSQPARHQIEYHRQRQHRLDRLQAVRRAPSTCPAFYVLGSTTIPTTVNLGGNGRGTNEVMLYAPNSDIEIQRKRDLEGHDRRQNASKTIHGNPTIEAGRRTSQLPENDATRACSQRTRYVECTGADRGAARTPTAEPQRSRSRPQRLPS